MLLRVLRRLGLVPEPCSHEFTVTGCERSMADDGEVVLAIEVRCVCGWVGEGSINSGITVIVDRERGMARA